MTMTPCLDHGSVLIDLVCGSAAKISKEHANKEECAIIVVSHGDGYANIVGVVSHGDGYANIRANEYYPFVVSCFLGRNSMMGDKKLNGMIRKPIFFVTTKSCWIILFVCEILTISVALRYWPSHQRILSSIL